VISEAAAVEPVDELADQVSRTTGLSADVARRVVADVLAYFTETTEEYVRRRHRELQTYGARNDEIFARLGTELRQWPVRSPELSARQLRRIVYG
jgi:polyhydroxyalkanoate synthesis regulator phasin